MKLRGNRNNLSPDWSREELAILSAYADPELPLKAVCARLPGRTQKAIQSKAYEAGITRRRGIRRNLQRVEVIIPPITIVTGAVTQWTAKEIAKPCTLYSNHLVGFKEIYEKLRPRTPNAIRAKAASLGLPRQRHLSRSQPHPKVEVSREPGYYNFNFNLSPGELDEFASHRR